MPRTSIAHRSMIPLCLAAMFVATAWGMAAAKQAACNRTVHASVAALDQPYMYNRLGATNPGGMMFALLRDVVGTDGQTDPAQFQPGQVRLRSDKRPRPLVLRMNVGDCLEIDFYNLLNPAEQSTQSGNVPTRYASLHAAGVELVDDIDDGGAWVGRNPNATASPVAPGNQKTYKWYAREEGNFLMYSGADPTGSQTGYGMFGSVNIQPTGAEWYRSQVTREDLIAAAYEVDETAQPAAIAGAPASLPVRGGAGTLTFIPAERGPQTMGAVPGAPQPGLLVNRTGQRKTVQMAEVEVIGGRLFSPAGHPIVNYQAVFPDGTPVLDMVQTIPGAQIFSQSVAPAERDRMLKLLDQGIVNTQLRELFANQKIQLSHTPSVTRGEPFEFVILDSGQGYLTRLTPATSGAVEAFEASFEQIYSDLTAIITGPNADRFPYSHNSPSFRTNPATPDRRQPYREFTIIYHQAQGQVQAFDFGSTKLASPDLATTVGNGRDQFGINYGIAGIGPEILANRLGVGPMGNPDAVDLKYEEFFLSAWSVGDPALLVDVPANFFLGATNTTGPDCTTVTLPPGQKYPQYIPNCETGEPPGNQSPQNPSPGPKATKAYFPDDPSNVYHSYMRDHVKFRISHAGTGPSHVHHLHAHQWLHSPNNDNGHYLDSQLIIPGSAYTLEITYNGSGNRNQTVGDSIFHCHFYPHFAQGMWSLWRVHDVFEAGTQLDEQGIPVAGFNRALPDGEITAGTPIPAVVPLPSLAMAPMPAPVRLTTAADGLAGRRAVVQPKGTLPDGTPEYDNPGYPFFIPGVAGHRAPHPPMDFAWKEDEQGRPVLKDDGTKQFLDGGLPRHLILNGTIVREFHNRWDFTKDFALYSTDDKKLQGPATFVAGNLTAFRLPEDGTAVEKAAMQAHATRTHPSVLPNGDPGNFILNGLPPIPGAPYAAPDVDDDGDSMLDIRRYKAAVIQMDVVLNKNGWHYPQQRFITLWGDVGDTTTGKRAPEPFFFRSNTGDSIEFWHTDLVPYYYELDDFQVRTPTDIIGQHIHLVKFDVTSSDGAANGFNYEDGTLSPDEVRDRILAINNNGGLFGFDNKTQFRNPAAQEQLAIKPYKDWYPTSFGEAPANQNWDGAQTTIQRWDTDPLLNNLGVDRTLRTVFTHDHFGPSTHQQVGLYAGMLVEPEDSQWFLPNGQRMNVREDGGPTSWEAVIVTQNPADSYREFMLEFQDTQLAYSAGSVSHPFDFATPTNLNIPVTPLFNTDGSVQDGSGTSITAGLGNGQVTQPLRDAFGQNGVTLSAQATAAPVSGNTCAKFSAGTPQWIVTDPKNPDQEEQYCIGTTNPPNSAAGTGTPIYVFLPDIYPGWSDPTHALAKPPAGTTGAPYPQLITFTGGSIGTYGLNYRSEPAPYRVESATGSSTGDLADVFRSSILRSNTALNTQPTPGTPIDPNQQDGFKYPPFLQPTVTGDGTSCALDTSNVGKVQPCDPYTPLLRAYANDKIQVRTLVGAHLQPHAFQIQGVEWNFEPSSKNSGFRNSQAMGLSEHFEMLFNLPPATTKADGDPPFADYLYAPSSGTVGLTNGAWGILRGYEEQIGQPGEEDYLMPLPENTPGTGAAIDYQALYESAPAARQRSFDITATTAAVAYCTTSPCSTPDGAVPYNQRASLTDPNGLIYVNTSDLNSNGQIKAGVPKEPLILRANAGDWIKVTLRNGFGSNPSLLNITGTLPSPFGSGGVPALNLNSSARVGLHPQLLAFDAKRGNGINVGFNPVDATVASGQPAKTYYWYAGDVFLEPGCQASGDDDCVRQVPVEYGATALVPTDMLGQHYQGLYGALIIEPEGSNWEFQTDPHDSTVTTRASAIVTPGDGSPAFHDFVLVVQNDVENYAGGLYGSINYRFEPFSARSNSQTGNPPLGYAQVLSNSTLSPPQDPETPIYQLAKGAPFRFRLVFPGGPANNGVTSPPVFTLDGHVWQEEPYILGSTVIGHNPFSQWSGGQNFLPYTVFDWVFPSAGGAFQVSGDYLYSGYQQLNANGLWGILRVTDGASGGGTAGGGSR